MTKEEKDKLIELSDLNMKDNIKYISSEAQGIAITLDSDRLAPSMCKLERAYICGRRKSEEQIAELEEKISVLLSCKKCPENKGGFICAKEYENKCLAQKIEYIKELQEENAVLEKRIERAKECMKKLLFIINSAPANYNCKGLVKDAEDFIHNRTCNIRQQGEHCITEERCIMCDK